MNNLAEELKRFPNPMKGKKELEALVPYLQRADENIVASLHGQGPHDTAKTCWFVLTNYNVFIVIKASMMGAPSVIALPLKDIDSAIENRGILLAKLSVTARGVNYTLHNAMKDQTKGFVEYFNKRKAELMQQPNVQSHVQSSPQAMTGTSADQQIPSEDVANVGAVQQPVAATSTVAAEQPKAAKKKPGCMTRILQGILIFFIIGVIGSFFADDKESKKVTQPKTDSQAVTNAPVKQESAKEATPEDIARKIITDTFGVNSNRDDLPRIMQMTSIPQVDGTLTLDCRLRINDNLTQRYIVLGFIKDTQRAMQKLFADSKLTGYNEFRFYGAFPMQDMYGNVREDFICKIFLKRSVAKKINWDNLTMEGFHSLLRRLNDGENCTYWWHGSALKGTNLN